MKKTIFFCVVTVLLSAGLMAQKTEKVQKETKSRDKAQVQKMKESDPQDNDALNSGEQKMINDRNEAASQGENVSTLAKETEPGPGHGEIVSQEAKSRGEAQKMRTKVPAANRSVNRNMGARGSVLHRNNIKMQKGHAGSRK